MKHFFLRTLGLALVCFFCMGTSSWALNVRFNLMYSPKHPLCKEGFMPWAEKVKAATEGRVKVTLFYSNALFKPKQAMDAITNRSADMGIVMPTYTRNRLLANGVMDLPMVAGEKARINSEVLWELYQKTPEMQKELSGMKVLWGFMNPAFQLHLTEKKVATLSDLDNLVISAGGTNQSKILQAFGASAEAMPMTEVYLALQKGVVQGCFLPYAPLRTQKIADLVKFHTNANVMATTFFITMNKKVWDKISPEDQKAIDALSGMTAATQTGSIFDKYQEKDIAWMTEKGDEFVNLSPEQQEKWAEKIMPIRQEWVNDAKSKGYENAETILNTALHLMAEKTK